MDQRTSRGDDRHDPQRVLGGRDLEQEEVGDERDRERADRHHDQHDEQRDPDRVERASQFVQHPQPEGDERQRRPALGVGDGQIESADAELVHRHRRQADDHAGRDREPQHAPDEPGTDRVVAGLERQHEPGDADRQRVDHGEVAGTQRVLGEQDAGQHGEHGGPHGLGEEQAGDPFDVGDDPPSLGHDAGQRGEAVVEQHDVTDRLGGRRPGAHGDAEVGVLQGERVVDAVAGHRHHLAPPLQRVQERPLGLGRHPPEHGRGVGDLGERGRFVREIAGIDVAVGVGTLHRRAIAATVTGLSPEITFGRTFSRMK